MGLHLCPIRARVPLHTGSSTLLWWRGCPAAAPPSPSGGLRSVRPGLAQPWTAGPRVGRRTTHQRASPAKSRLPCPDGLAGAWSSLRRESRRRGVRNARKNEVRETTSKSSQDCARARGGERPVSCWFADAGEAVSRQGDSGTSRAGALRRAPGRRRTARTV